MLDCNLNSIDVARESFVVGACATTKKNKEALTQAHGGLKERDYCLFTICLSLAFFFVSFVQLVLLEPRIRREKKLFIFRPFPTFGTVHL